LASAPDLHPRLVNEVTAARYLGRGRTRFREQVKKGELPGPTMKNGRIPLWDVKRLDSFLDAVSNIEERPGSWDDL
jgi:hypothetical protein